MPFTSRSWKRNCPKHSAPSQQIREKNNKSIAQELESGDVDEYICDRCTESVEDFIHYKRCEMWLCSKCQMVPSEVISKHSELRVHWFCKLCDKLALNSVKN